MTTTIKDDRTPEQQQTHRYGVVARDRFLTGWGRAKNGTSWCAWASDNLNDTATLLDWVRRRSEMRNVRIADLATYIPAHSAEHFHIYVVDPQVHPAFTEPSQG